MIHNPFKANYEVVIDTLFRDSESSNPLRLFWRPTECSRCPPGHCYSQPPPTPPHMGQVETQLAGPLADFSSTYLMQGPLDLNLCDCFTPPRQSLSRHLQRPRRYHLFYLFRPVALVFATRHFDSSQMFYY